jgi:hypothetical protein
MNWESDIKKIYVKDWCTTFTEEQKLILLYTYKTMKHRN